MNKTVVMQYSILAPLCLVLLRASPIGLTFTFVLIVVPSLFVIWGIWVIFPLRACLNIFRNKLYSKTVMPLGSFCLFLLFLLSPLSFLYRCYDAGDILHFFVMRSAYMEKIAHLHSTTEPKLIVFDRGGMIGASAGYIYDESDEVELPRGRQSANWKKRADNTELACNEFQARPFLAGLSVTKHFYLAGFGC